MAPVRAKPLLKLFDLRKGFDHMRLYYHLLCWGEHRVKNSIILRRSELVGSRRRR